MVKAGEWWAEATAAPGRGQPQLAGTRWLAPRRRQRGGKDTVGETGREGRKNEKETEARDRGSKTSGKGRDPQEDFWAVWGNPSSVLPQSLQ